MTDFVGGRKVDCMRVELKLKRKGFELFSSSRSIHLCPSKRQIPSGLNEVVDGFYRVRLPHTLVFLTSAETSK